MRNKKNRIGYFYVILVNKIRTSHHTIRKLGKTIGKIGITTRSNPFSRFNAYPEDSELVSYYKIKNLWENEEKVIEKICNEKYKVDIDGFSGKEYFDGNIAKVLQDIEALIEEDMIEVCDIDKDICQGRFHWLNIYYDELINPMYYHYLCENHGYTNYTNNRKNRNVMTRFILMDYRDMLIEKGFSFSDHEEESEKDSDEEEKEENEIHICHHCVKYTTSSMSDMIRHFKRKNKCVSNSDYTYEEASKISTKKKYTFLFDYKNLNIEDLKFIILNYNQKINEITEDYRNISKVDISVNETVESIDDLIKKNICPNCMFKFSTIYTLIRHCKNEKSCTKKQFLNKFFK